MKKATYFWSIPKEVATIKTITPSSKIIFGMLYTMRNGKQYAFPGQKMIADELGMTIRGVRKCLTQLEENQLIKRIRRGKRLTNNYELFLPSEEEQCSPSENSEGNNSSASEGNNSSAPYVKDEIEKMSIVTNVTKAEPKLEEFGDPEINWVLSEFERIKGYKSRGKRDRFMAKHLINNYTRENLTTMIIYSVKDRFSPRISNVEDLWYKQNQLKEGLRKYAESQTKTLIIS